MTPTRPDDEVIARGIPPEIADYVRRSPQFTDQPLVERLGELGAEQAFFAALPHKNYEGHAFARIALSLREAASELTRLQQELSAAKRERESWGLEIVGLQTQLANAPEALEQARLSGFRECADVAWQALDKALVRARIMSRSVSSDAEEFAQIGWSECRDAALDTIRSLSPPIEATDESVSPPAIDSSEEMVERVARAICEAASGPFELLTEAGREACRDEARAAIASMSQKTGGEG